MAKNPIDPKDIRPTPDTALAEDVPPPTYSSLNLFLKDQENLLVQDKTNAEKPLGLFQLYFKNGKSTGSTATTSPLVFTNSRNGTSPCAVHVSFQCIKILLLLSILIPFIFITIILATRVRVFRNESIIQTKTMDPLKPNNYRPHAHFMSADSISIIHDASSDPLKKPGAGVTENIFGRLHNDCKRILLNESYDGSGDCEATPFLTQHLEVQAIPSGSSLKTLLEKYNNLVSLVLNFENICSQDMDKAMLSLASLQLTHLADLSIENTRKCPDLSPILEIKAPKLEKLNFEDIRLDQEAYTKIKQFLQPMCRIASGSFRKLAFSYSDLCDNCIFNWSDFHCMPMTERSFLYCNIL